MNGSGVGVSPKDTEIVSCPILLFFPVGVILMGAEDDRGGALGVAHRQLGLGPHQQEKRQESVHPDSRANPNARIHVR
jgi:hypothetical protein